MFLVGGPAYSGTTLLAHILNQPGVVCLDEPDFHNPEQNHRGIPFLRQLFPHAQFPPRAERPLSYLDAVAVIAECQHVLRPIRLGVKTCNRMFIDYAKIYREQGHPVLAIVRDIRDALVRQLPPWLSADGLNERYCLIWSNRHLFNLCIRYEDLVAEPQRTIAQISTALCVPLVTKDAWGAQAVHAPMFKDERHQLLRGGTISDRRVGIHKTAGRPFSRRTLQTARMMGYD